MGLLVSSNLFLNAKNGGISRKAEPSGHGNLAILYFTMCQETEIRGSSEQTIHATLPSLVSFPLHLRKPEEGCQAPRTMQDTGSSWSVCRLDSIKALPFHLLLAATLWSLVPNPGYTMESAGEFNRYRGLGPIPRESDGAGLGT